MTRRDDSIRLEDMLKAATEAVGFARGRDEQDLGRDRHADLPWADMIGMRNRLVHAYFDIDLSLLWTTVTVDLPMLIRQLQQIAGK